MAPGQARGPDHTWPSARKAHRLPSPTLANWLDADGRIGHAFPAGRVDHSSAARNGDVWDVQYVSSLESFAEDLVTGAVILGTERVCSTLADWTRGAPVPFRITGVLDSLALDRPVSPTRGVRVESLPTASDQLLAGLPDRPGLVHYAYLGRTLVSVDAEPRPRCSIRRPR